MNREPLLQLSCTICGNTKLYDKNSSWVCNKCKNKYSFVEKGIQDCSKNIFGSDTYHWHNDIATNQNKSSPKSVGFKFSFHQKCLIDVFIDATKDIDKGLFLDVGCGNGKYLNINPDIFVVGSDRCMSLTQTAREKDLEVISKF